MATEHTPFKLNFGKHLWKGNLIIKIELPKLEDFLEGLQGSQEAVKKSMEIAKAIKRQSNKKRKNLQGLKLEITCGQKL